MKLYFVQHGIAAAKEVDENRPLLEIGYNDSNKIAIYLKQHNIEINKICHSGKLRAKQTAEIFSKQLKVDNVIEVSNMSPNDDPDFLIGGYLEEKCMYVGHLPNLQKVVAQLVAGDQERDVIKFQNSAIVCLEIEEDRGRVLWFIPPSMC
ncbi:phosphohistidine phosphatase SixA [Endozoicomonas sp. SM1973]|uniref:Phosphohistidine phosphatase SixA n=1 Tax=Spartinivicinus marinus TaxID=2994442 RepID=A0A853IG13_9GAMM|nr:phosphohistidine phosphatase SixA [Spartinivicinus marinus]MCX4027782.1 phosphohistidine phosphatase SixA [Spartinivicinus marinus]NYZ68964.1 phosphohistidine phosphatase SixA [Spartinivicinus marinus]